MKKINKLLVFGIYFKYALVCGALPIKNLLQIVSINEYINLKEYQGDPEIERLNIKIQQLNLGAFNPFKFELVKAEIEGSFSAKKITIIVKKSLINDINSILASRIYNECDKFLIKTSSNCTKEISWLNLLENKIGVNQKITNYKIKLKEQLRQIELYTYYTISLPKEIRKWINSGEVNFDTNTYSKYRSQLSEMPANFKYKNENKLNKIHSELRNELDSFFYEWQSPAELKD
jgi:hypothetical protein